MLTELNILKFYGILLVVLGHVVFTYSPMSIITPSTPSPILNSVKEVIYAFHMLCLSLPADVSSLGNWR